MKSRRDPLAGNCHPGLWYDLQLRACSDGDKQYRDDVGVYVSVDQTLLRETGTRPMRWSSAFACR